MGPRSVGRSSWTRALAAAVLAVRAFVARADEVADFYKGKQIRVIIGTNAGGAYDLYARTIIRHMGKHLPGNPSFIPQNMEGAGGRTAGNWLSHIAPRDGSVIGTMSQSAPLDQAMKQPGIQYDVTKFGWIGNPVIDNLITITWSSSGLATIADVKAKGGLICGGTGATTPGIVNPKILGNLLNSKVRIIAGYAGILPIGLAMEQGELNCMGGNSWATMRSSMNDFLIAHKFDMLVQWGPKKNPDVSTYQGRDVPLITEFAQNDFDKKVLDLIDSGVSVGRPLLAPPGAPPPRLAALRRAFDDTMTDPEFLADAAAQKLDISPVPGETLQRIVTDVAQANDAVLERANELMTLKDVTEIKK